MMIDRVEVVEKQTDRREVSEAINKMTSPFSTFEQNGYSLEDGLKGTQQQMRNILDHSTSRDGKMIPGRKALLLRTARMHSDRPAD